MSLINFLLSSAIGLLAFRSFNIILIWSVIANSENNSVALGLVVALMWAFNLVSSPFSGDFLDKYRKRSVLIVGAVLSITFTILFVGNLIYHDSSLVLMSVCASVLAATNSITSSSINSVIPFIAERSQLTRAIGLASTFNSLQTIIGALLGGSLIAFFGVTLAGVLVLGLYVVSLSLLIFVHIEEPERESCPVQHDEPVFFKRMIAGFKILYHINCERVMCYAAMIINFVLTPLFMVVIPFYVVEELHADAKVLAVFEATFAVGMLLGATVLSRVDFNTHRRIYPIVVGDILMGLGVIGFSLFEAIPLKALCLSVAGFGLTSDNVAFHGVRAFAAPDSHRARLEGAIFFLCIATIPLGSQFFGYLIHLANGPQLDWVLMAIGLLITATSILPLLSTHTLDILKLSNRELDQLYTNRYPAAFED